MTIKRLTTVWSVAMNCAVEHSQSRLPVINHIHTRKDKVSNLPAEPPGPIQQYVNRGAKYFKCHFYRTYALQT